MRLFVLMFSLALTWGISADLIYWQIQVDESAYDTTSKGAYTYAQFAYVNGGTKSYMTIADANGKPLSDPYGPVQWVEPSDQSYWAVMPEGNSNGNYDGYTFFVETFNSAGDQIGWSAQLSYDNISKFIKTSHMSAVITPLTLNVVPEPTSGLLVLMGGALLALRRRRRA